jgi:signal transduction histidine kinase
VISLCYPFSFSNDYCYLFFISLSFLFAAYKFTPEHGRVLVRVETVAWRLQDSSPRVKIQVSVSDSGRGIDEADQRKLFQPWAQIRAAEQQGMFAFV